MKSCLNMGGPPSKPKYSLLTDSNSTLRPEPPPTVVAGFGLVPVRSPLLGESLLLSFPDGTEMFQFPSFAPLTR